MAKAEGSWGLTSNLYWFCAGRDGWGYKLSERRSENQCTHV